MALAATVTCARSENGTAPLPIEEWSRATYSGWCEAGIRCSFESDFDFCMKVHEFESRSGYFALTVQAVHAGKIRYDGVAARTCAERSAAVTCQDLGDPAKREDSPECRAAFTGTVPASGHCFAPVECTPGTTCIFPEDPLACAGVCTAVDGRHCNDSDDCPEGLVCGEPQDNDDPRSTGSCVVAQPPGTDGQPCGTNRTCQPGLTCVEDPIATPPICVRRKHAGETCPRASAYACDDGLICAVPGGQLEGTCWAPLPLGASCSFFSACGPPPHYCDETDGLCKELPSSGPCVVDTSAVPVSFYCNKLTSYCDVRAAPPTCKPNVGPGESCTDDGQCQSLQVPCTPAGSDPTVKLCGVPAGCGL